MKLLHYTGVYAPAWKWGGPPRSNANLAEGLAALGHKVTVFTTNAGLETDAAIPTDRPVQRNGAEVHYFPSFFNFMGLQSPDLEKAVRSRVREFDLIHITGVWQPTSLAACRAAEAAGVPYVVSPRGALSPYSFGQKPWKKWLYWRLRERRNCDRATFIHFTATQEKKECDRLNLRAKPVVIPNAIDLSAWYRDEPAGAAWRRILAAEGVHPDTKILLYVGRLHHKKGLDLLPEALAQIELRAWHLVLVGDDEDGTRERLRTAFQALKLQERVTFQPATNADGLRAAYSGADLFLLPSRHENFGNVAVEAMACGCPALLSDQVGAAEDLAKFSGVRVAPRSARAWSSLLSESLEKKEDAPPAAEIRKKFETHALAAEMAVAYHSSLQP